MGVSVGLTNGFRGLVGNGRILGTVVGVGVGLANGLGTLAWEQERADWVGYAGHMARFLHTKNVSAGSPDSESRPRDESGNLCLYLQNVSTPVIAARRAHLVA